MDFCLGRVTRPHDDVDWYVRDNDLSRLTELLIGQGWEPLERLPHERQVDLRRGSVDLSMSPVSLDRAGRPIVGPGPWAGKPLPADMLSGSGRAELSNVTASYISPMSQIELKLMTPIWRRDLARREKDGPDVYLLCSHLLERCSGGES